jgi:hypothetical protein
VCLLAAAKIALSIGQSSGATTDKTLVVVVVVVVRGCTAGL